MLEKGFILKIKKKKQKNFYEHFRLINKKSNKEMFELF